MSVGDDRQYDVFVSCNADDRSNVEHLVQRLEAAGLRVWMMSRILAGAPWVEAIETAMGQSTSVIVCFGPSGMGRWQQTEVEAAMDRHRRGEIEALIPTLLPGVAGGDPQHVGLPRLLATYHVVDFRMGLNAHAPWRELLAALDLPVPPEAPPRKTAKVAPEARERRAASVAVMHRGRILLVQRSKTQRTGAGMWQLPGGKIASGERPCDAARREIEEETGIRLTVPDLREITEVADVWLDRQSGQSMIMHLFAAEAPDDRVRLASELISHEWIHVSELFVRDTRTYFGSTSHFLRLLRRYFQLHLPLSQLADCLEGGGAARVDLPHTLEGLSMESTQVMYAVLSLFGFLDDRGRFSAASVLSASLVKTLAAWASTGGQIFEARGVAPADDRWYRLATQKGEREQVDRYRGGVFQQHENLLGFLSHRLQKALSTRTVADVLVFARDTPSGHVYVLLRWDLLAEKFQIPARGLESLEGDPASIDAARYVVEDRLDPRLVDSFAYDFVGAFETAHVSAGSLDDGPLMRKYRVNVFRLTPSDDADDAVPRYLSLANEETLGHLRAVRQVQSGERKGLRYYVWASLETLLAQRVALLGRKLQGVDELMQHLGPDVFEPAPRTLSSDLRGGSIPVIDADSVSRSDDLEYVLRRFDCR